jgi:Lrp/AsnC family transcriptional regulator, leucine-responsive regulatory protein
MASPHDRLLDSVTWDILRALDSNARMSYKELAHRVGLTPPAVAERMRRLEDAGIIRGYRVELDLARIGLPVLAMLRMGTPTTKCERVAEILEALPEILECHRVTGTDAFVMLVATESIAQLESLVDHLMPYGQITTSLVFSSPVSRRNILRQPVTTHNGA